MHLYISEATVEKMVTCAKNNKAGGSDQELYLMEECAEFVEATLKRHRGKDTERHQNEEAMDLICCGLVYCIQRGIDFSVLEEHINYKCGRAIERFEKHGTL